MLAHYRTMSRIRAFQEEPHVRQRLAALLDGKDDGAAVAAEVIQVVKRTGGIEAARALAREHTAAAMEALEKVPEGPHRRAIAEAAQHLTERAF